MKELKTHFDPIGHRNTDGHKVIFNEDIAHYMLVPEDDGEPVRFKWHFQRGILSKKMTGYEIAVFIVPHMHAMISMGLLDDNKRAKLEFETMFLRLVTSPREAIDKLLSWIKVEFHEQDDDIIYLSLFDKTPQKGGPIFSLPLLT